MGEEPTPQLTRRGLLAWLPALAATTWTSRLSAQIKMFTRKPKSKAMAPQTFVYFGTDTSKPGAKGIYVSRFTTATGQLSEPVLAAVSYRPAFFATARVDNKQFLYATNEGDEHTSAVSTFLIDSASGSLKPVGEVSAGGIGPCYIDLNSSSTVAFTANYSGSSITSFKVLPGGRISEPVERVDFKQKAFGHHGPNASRQEASHPHATMLSPDDRFLVVNDLGNDTIVTFSVHPETARLGPPRVYEARELGSGPRHMAFHPNGRWAYSINELSSTIDHFLWNTTHAVGATEPEAFLTNAGPSVSTLDPSFKGVNTAAEIAVTPDGFFVIASNRGEDSLVVFHVDPASGVLTLKQRISCGGKAPRQFTLDPSGLWLVCGNQNSASVTVFSRNASTGELRGPTQTLPLESPMMALFS